MNKRTWAMLVVMASVGVSACSPASQKAKDAEESASVTAKKSIAQAKVVYYPDDNYGYGKHNYVPVSTSYKPNLNSNSGYQAVSYQPASYTPAARVVAPAYFTNKPITPTGMPRLSKAELLKIGNQIFKNEAGGRIDGLVHWNEGEDFAAMGIGHFTWYPAGRRTRFGNTFPQLLDYFVQNGVALPTWLHQARRHGAPWRSRHELKRAKGSAQVRELQDLLMRTKELQAQYIVDRARKAMPRLVQTAPPHLRPLVAQNLNAVANTPGGWYALVDYVNFKGEGLNRKGGYRGQNWGLLQVLENMRPSQPGPQALQAFSVSAYQVLERRVRNSPKSRGERRWLAGWANRVATYRNPLGLS